MNRSDWKRHLESEWENIIALVDEKTKEYVRDNDDVLINFKRGGGYQRTIPERALLGVMSKHVTSIVDFIVDLESGKCENYSKWREKCFDNIVYLFLLLALIKERLGDEL